MFYAPEKKFTSVIAIIVILHIWPEYFDRATHVKLHTLRHEWSYWYSSDYTT